LSESIRFRAFWIGCAPRSNGNTWLNVFI
jgi:hypothetical protein